MGKKDKDFNNLKITLKPEQYEAVRKLFKPTFQAGSIEEHIFNRLTVLMAQIEQAQKDLLYDDKLQPSAIADRIKHLDLYIKRIWNFITISDIADYGE